jgi:hypothetical protein
MIFIQIRREILLKGERKKLRERERERDCEREIERQSGKLREREKN